MTQKVKLLRNIEDGEKLAPQLRAIVDTLAEVGIGKEVDRKDLVKMLADKPDRLVTRQPVDRILAYYAPHLKDAKLVEFIREGAAVKEKKEKAEKPAAKAAEKPVKAPAAA